MLVTFVSFQSKIHLNLSSFPTYSGDAFAFGCLRCAWLEEKSLLDKWHLEDSQPLTVNHHLFISDIGINDYVLEIVNGCHTLELSPPLAPSHILQFATWTDTSASSHFEFHGFASFASVVFRFSFSFSLHRFCPLLFRSCSSRTRSFRPCHGSCSLQRVWHVSSCVMLSG